MERTSTITIGEVEYRADYAAISEAFIGWEEHNCFTAYLTFTGRGRGWTQGEQPRSWTPIELNGYLQTVLSVLGVKSWAEVLGQEVLVLKRTPKGPIEGFAHRYESRSVLFAEIVD